MRTDGNGAVKHSLPQRNCYFVRSAVYHSWESKNEDFIRDYSLRIWKTSFYCLFLVFVCFLRLHYMSSGWFLFISWSLCLWNARVRGMRYHAWLMHLRWVCFPSSGKFIDITSGSLRKILQCRGSQPVDCVWGSDNTFTGVVCPMFTVHNSSKTTLKM